MYDRQRVIDIALAEVGYLEKETTANLDDKTANAGDENRTKYARDLDAVNFYNGKKQGVAWCDTFVDWSFYEAYGLEAALKLTCQALGSAGAGCRYSRAYYKNKGQLFDSPEPGDQVFFWPKDRSDPNKVQHTGLVYAVDDTYVYTVEGNTSGASGVVWNGGGVCKKKYKRTYERLAGFGRPDWDMDGVVEGSANSSASSSTTSTAKTYKLGDRTLSKGCEGDDVKELQEALNKLPCIVTKLEVDGDFGTNTARAVYTFQTIYEIKVDSKYGPESHKTLMAALEDLEKQAEEDASSKAEEAPSEPAQTPTKKIVTIVSERLVNLRNGDSLNAGRVTQVKGGTQFEWVATINGWHGVRYKNRIVWVSGDFSKVSEA